MLGWCLLVRLSPALLVAQENPSDSAHQQCDRRSRRHPVAVRVSALPSPPSASVSTLSPRLAYPPATGACTRVQRGGKVKTDHCSHRGGRVTPGRHECSAEGVVSLPDSIGRQIPENLDKISQLIRVALYALNSDDHEKAGNLTARLTARRRRAMCRGLKASQWQREEMALEQKK